MNVSSFKPRLLGSSMLIAAAIALGATVPALADNSITQGVTTGGKTAIVSNLGLTAVSSSHSAQPSDGSMTLTADDSTGSGLGWHVSILSSNFVYSGTAGGSDIAAVNFALLTTGDPAKTSGQVVDGTNGPAASGATGTFDSAHTVLTAQAGFGQGTYTQALGVELTVPANSRVGTYTGTLTTTITAAP